MQAVKSIGLEFLELAFVHSGSLEGDFGFDTSVSYQKLLEAGEKSGAVIDSQEGSHQLVIWQFTKGF